MSIHVLKRLGMVIWKCCSGYVRSQDPPFPWNTVTCFDAARNGHFDVMQWLHTLSVSSMFLECVSLCLYSTE